MAWTRDFLDTFTHYAVTTSTVTVLGKWTTLNGASVAATIAEDGMQGISPQDLRRNCGTTTSGRMVGCRVFPNNFVNGESGLIAILDGSGLVISIGRVETTGVLKLYRPGVTTTSATAILPGLTGANLELAFLADGVNHRWEVRVNGVQVADLTGTAANATTYQLHTISPSRGGGSGVCQSTYAWFWTKTYSGSGGVWSASDFYGNVRRGVQRADAEGLFAANVASAEWSPLAPDTTFYETLDETLADSDTSYITTTTDPGGSPTDLSKASWGMSDSDPDIATVIAVQRGTTARSPVGTASIKLLSRDIADSNPANTTEETARNLSSSWFTELTQYPLDPRDSSAWSKAKLDSLELGIEMQDFT